MPNINNSAPTLGLSDANLYRRTQLSSLPIRRVSFEEHRDMLAKYAQAPVSFALDHTFGTKRCAVAGGSSSRARARGGQDA